MTLPKRLYKYETFCSQSLENLKNQAVYFGAPRSFNDPYDCALTPSVKDLSDDDIERIRSHYLAHEQVEPRARAALKSDSSSSIRVALLRVGQDLIDAAVQRFLLQNGVSCFSERNDSLLMWGHYGGRFKGFCLEFRTDCELFSRAKKVRYSQKMPAIDLVPLICKEDQAQEIIDLYCTKALDWQYEKEWRVLHETAGTVFHYPAEALTGVFIGPDASFASLEIISLILAGQNPNVQVWRGSRSKSEFTVLYEPISYIAYNEAKRRGLLSEGGA